MCLTSPMPTTVILNSTYMCKQNRYAAVVGMHINALKVKGMSALMPGEQRKSVLLDGEALEDVDSSLGCLRP